ncbi:MAG TPA: YfhO family protein [Pyrinomonadaceae bacterium]|nr:YfhO family protein [Pyrinomonadaceae bacterium]
MSGRFGPGLWRRRRRDACALAVVVLFFTAFFPHTLFGDRFVIAGDAFFYSYPLRTVAWEMIRAGQLPLWTPYVLSGYPLLSMAQLALAYPFTWGHLFLPGHWAEQIYVFAPFLLSPVFTYAYAREVGRSRAAALLAGLAFGYGGMMCSGIANSGMLTNSMLWLPLLLIPIDRAARGRGFSSCLLGATLAYAMSVLNGHGQSFVYVGLAAASYGAFLTLALILWPAGAAIMPHEAGGEAGVEAAGARARGGWRAWASWRPLAVACGALLLAGGVAAFQILETLRAARRSVRGELTFELLGEGSFKPGEAFKSIFAPFYHYVDVTAYVSPLALFFVPVACLVAARRGRRGDARVIFWAAAAVVAWLLMLGINSPTHHLFFRVPFLNRFRVPSRHALEWTLALSVLAAYGWDAAARFARRRAGARRAGAKQTATLAAACAALAAAASVGLLWYRAAAAPPVPGVTSEWTGLFESSYLLWKGALALLLLLAVWLAWRLRARGVRAALLAAAIFLGCYVEQYIIITHWWGGPKLSLTSARFSAVSPTTRMLQSLPPEQNRVYTRAGLFTEEFTNSPRFEPPNLHAPHHLHAVGAMEPLILDRYSRALGGVGPDSVTPRPGFPPNESLFGARSHVLDVLNTTHVVSFMNLRPGLEPALFKEGLAFSGADLAADIKPGERVTLGGAQSEGETLALVTVMSNSADVADGETVALVRVGTEDGRRLEYELRAGVDTAEWAHARPDVSAAVRHARAPVFDERPGDAEGTFTAYRYLTSFKLGGLTRVSEVEVENVAARATLSVMKATLFKQAGALSTPLFPRLADKWEKIYDENFTWVLRNRRALPRAWLVAEVESVDGEEALLRLQGAGARPFDPRRTALLEVAPPELPALPGGELAPGSGARVAEYEPNRLVIETDADAPALLVVSEIFYPGWEATVDGSPARIHNTNFLLRGVALPAGTHRVEMRYTAPAARNGAIISACTLVGLCLLWIFGRRRRRA